MIAQDSITLYDEAGTPHIWTQTGTGGTTAWSPPDGEHGTLSVAAGSGIVTLIDEDGSRTVFSNTGQVTEYQPSDVTGSATALQYAYTGTPSRLSTITDPISGMQAKLTYDGGGGTACSTTYGTGSGAPCGDLAKIEYPDQSTTVLQYAPGAAGQLIRIIDPGNEITDFAYNTAGQLSKARDPLAADAVAAGQGPADDTTVSLISYDTPAMSSDAPRVTAIQGPEPTPGAPRPGRHYTYQLAPTSTADGATLVNVDGIAPASGYSAKAMFNADLRGTSSTDALGRITQTVYNTKDQLAKSTDPAGRVSTTIYDYADRPTAQYGPAPASCFTATGTPTAACAATVPASTTAHDEGLTGLHTDWWNNTDYSGVPAVKSVQFAGGGITADWGTGVLIAGVNADNFSARSTGYLTFPVAGQYTFALTGDESATVLVNNKKLATSTPGAGNGSLISVAAGQVITVMWSPICTDDATQAAKPMVGMLD